MQCVMEKRASAGMHQDDLEFLMNTELLRATPDEYKKQLLSAMSPMVVPCGSRFIAQGDTGDGLYLIQNGTCVVSLEKCDQSYPLSRLKAGDIVGEVATLTGEKRRANVVAESDMVVWHVIPITIDALVGQCTDVHEFLSNLATERLCSQKITAERSIGKYTITEVIAEGGWSIVYKGYHSFLKLPVAIKMLKHNMAIDADFFNKFQDEAKVIACLDHENIVRVYDVEHLYKTAFIVMEYLDGVTLKQVLKTFIRLPLPRICDILLQICAGLDFAHQHHIVHQDVKPGNVFIQTNDRVRIVDFGLACPIGCCSNDMNGTAFYMAPEQIEGEPVDPRTDIYALGITAFEMATGRLPFSGDVCDVLRAQITEPTPDPRIWNMNLPKEFCRFIEKATRKDPATRYENLRQVRDDLIRAAERSGTAARTQAHRKRKMMTMFTTYGAEHQSEVTRLVETFSLQLNELGANLRVAEFEDL